MADRAVAPIRPGREVVVQKDGRRVERGAASAVDLLTRLRGEIRDPDELQVPPPPKVVLWDPVVPTGVDVVDLRRELEAARRAGVQFDDAWPEARRRVLATIPTAVGYKSPRKTFLSAIDATRQAWAEAYHDVGEPPRFVGALVAALDEDDGDGIVGGPRRHTRSSW